MSNREIAEELFRRIWLRSAADIEGDTRAIESALDAAERRGPHPGYCTVCKTDFGDAPMACDCEDPRYAAGVRAGKIETLETLAADVRNHGWASALYCADVELARLRAEQEESR